MFFATPTLFLQTKNLRDVHNIVQSGQMNRNKGKNTRETIYRQRERSMRELLATSNNIHNDNTNN